MGERRRRRGAAAGGALLLLLLLLLALPLVVLLMPLPDGRGGRIVGMGVAFACSCVLVMVVNAWLVVSAVDRDRACVVVCVVVCDGGCSCSLKIGPGPCVTIRALMSRFLPFSPSTTFIRLIDRSINRGRRRLQS